jgi:hypothetical protein
VLGHGFDSEKERERERERERDYLKEKFFMIIM